ncbi:MAG: hypothetical protein R2742_05810 [Micropruina glycogenica]
MTRFNQAKAAAEHSHDREELDRLTQFRSDLTNYCKAYAFPVPDRRLRRHRPGEAYIFYKASPRSSPSTASTSVSLTGLALTTTASPRRRLKLDLETGEPTPLTPMLAVGAAQLHDPQNARWAEIIDAINTLFDGSGLSETEDRASGPGVPQSPRR